MLALELIVVLVRMFYVAQSSYHKRTKSHELTFRKAVTSISGGRFGCCCGSHVAFICFVIRGTGHGCKTKWLSEEKNESQ